MDGGAVLDEFIRAHRENRPLLEKLRDAIRSFIAKLTGMEKKKAQTAEGMLNAALEAAAKEAKTLQGQPDNGKMAEKYSLKDLTEEENTALTNYKSSESYKVNAKLRDGGELTETEQGMVKALDSALEKLPTVKGALYRTLNFDDTFSPREEYEAFIAQHVEGAFVRYKAFTSASTKADGYPLAEGTKYGVTLEITSRTARDLEGIGNNFENEALFRRKATFDISKVVTDKNGRIYIYMEEIQTNGGEKHSGHDTQERSMAVRSLQEAHSAYADLQSVSETDPRGDHGRGQNLQGSGDEAKHSLKTGTLTKSYSAILEENRLLREQTKDYLALRRRNRALEASRDYWQGQTRRSRQVTTDRKAVEKAAKGLSTC